MNKSRASVIFEPSPLSERVALKHSPCLLLTEQCYFSGGTEVSFGITAIHLIFPKSICPGAANSNVRPAVSS